VAVNSGQSLVVERLLTKPNGGCPVATIVVEIPESCKSLLEPVLALVRLVEKLSHPARRERDFAGVEAQIGAATARVECAALGEVLRSLDATTDWVVFEGATRTTRRTSGRRAPSRSSGSCFGKWANTTVRRSTW
jgi:hypothetical protein